MTGKKKDGMKDDYLSNSNRLLGKTDTKAILFVFIAGVKGYSKAKRMVTSDSPSV